eukprot:Protomagalhaensia_wolfi_Nauph_80__444@NODE_1248_length_1636_cov_402_596744_g657_i1_p2_GENE_NODE_1248_length_1636_cov_402_596744_g657_i1NODE_1248_length_1636_cov_402_596744_g657_i1_p2_ORF_typecomplete_len133_score7_10LysR_substrate/PF03466_20/0_02_NODE_1248_length_1636_cov_402_596744_g657_i16131011
MPLCPYVGRLPQKTICVHVPWTIVSNYVEHSGKRPLSINSLWGLEAAVVRVGVSESLALTWLTQDLANWLHLVPGRVVWAKTHQGKTIQMRETDLLVHVSAHECQPISFDIAILLKLALDPTSLVAEPLCDR